jgi:N-Acetylglucosaminyltransferase-IV (GnT-IV) conserved region
MKRRDFRRGLKYFIPAIIFTFASLTFTTQVYVVHRLFPEDSSFAMRPKAQILNNFEREVIWGNYSYNRTRFFASINNWRSRLNHRQLHCLVLIPPRSTSVISLTEDLIGTIDAALSSRTAQVVVHVRKRDVEVVASIIAIFSKHLMKEQLILLMSEYEPSIFDNDNSTYHLRDGLELSYMLDLSHQSGSNFSMVLWPGWRLTKSFSSSDFVADALHHYEQVEKTRKSSNDFNRTCWTVLSDLGIKRDDDVLLLDTAEHASRIVKFLRSTLPYNRKKYPELLDIYCKHFIWSGSVLAGPSLFALSTSTLQIQVKPTSSRAEVPYLEESSIVAPPWIDHVTTFGPRISNDDPQYLIAFGVNAMIRPIVNTTYLEQFMDSLLRILTTTFSLTPENSEGNNRSSAVIAVLVSGNSSQEIKHLRGVLEAKYADAIDSQLVRLVDSPLETFIPLLENRRSTYNESSGRRTWRSKQNLDVGAVLQATSGLSEYVMLLEDDTGFQPKFAEKLMSTLLEDKKSSTISWSQMDFGFGYSGILIRAADAPVYQQLHQTFFDEIPCDLLGNWRVVQNGKRVYVYSPISLRYKKRLYLKHLGKQSSLVGKTQNVW